MYQFFQYNWQVRDEWFDWCEQLPLEELLRKRTGGIGNIFHTLLHIIDVEYSWIRAIQGRNDLWINFDDFLSIEEVRKLSNGYRSEINDFLLSDETNSDEIVTASWMDGTFSKNEVLHHIITHEIHHIGQLSIWARELDLKPVSANVIFRGLF
jgi:uncharacterized damage-inducible protein DinB